MKIFFADHKIFKKFIFRLFQYEKYFSRISDWKFYKNSGLKKNFF